MRFLLLLLLALYSLFNLFLLPLLERYSLQLSAKPSLEEGKLLLKDLRFYAKLKDKEVTASLREAVLFPSLKLRKGTLAFLSTSEKKEEKPKKKLPLRRLSFRAFPLT